MNEGDSNDSNSSSSPLRHFRHCLPPSCYSMQDMLHYNPASPQGPSFDGSAIETVSNQQHFAQASNGQLDQPANLGNHHTLNNKTL